MNNTLVPNYIDIDYNTMISRLKGILSKSDTFKDYDFEGANFTILMELMAYVNEVNTYYTNALAKNIHNETADVYEVVHSLVRRQGYEPKGYISGICDLTITVTTTSSFDDPNITIPKWFKFDTGVTSSLGNKVYYYTNSNISLTVDTNGSQSSFKFTISVVEGEPNGPLLFDYDDIINNRLYLPLDTWDHSIDNDSIEVYVDTTNELETFYTRVTNDNTSADLTYTLNYDKYKRYYIEFSNVENIKNIDNVVKVILSRSNGLDGSVKIINTWDNSVNGQLIPSLDGGTISNILVNGNVATVTSIINTNSSSNGNPDTIDELKLNGNSNMFSQLRNVTSQDYINHLSANSMITNAYAWGEKEARVGDTVIDTTKFNKVYISMITEGMNTTSSKYIEVTTLAWNSLHYYPPNSIVISNGAYYKTVLGGTSGSNGPSGTGNITDGTVTWNFINIPYDTEFTAGSTKITSRLLIPRQYYTSFLNSIITYLKPRQMIGVNEEFIIPEITYFKYVIGLRTKKPYIWSSVKTDVEAKLILFFSSNNRIFGDIIDPSDIVNFIMDSTITTEQNSFVNIKGITSLTIRNVVTHTTSMLLNTVSDGVTVGPYSTNKIFNQDVASLNGQHYRRYPYYMNVGSTVNNNSTSYYDNYTKPIKLGSKQYPVLAPDYCVYINEER